MKTIEEKIKKEKEKQNKKTFRKWWQRNGCIVLRIVLWPACLIVTVADWAKKRYRKKLVFSKQTCCKYLNKMLPNMVATMCEDADAFLISNDKNECDDIAFIDFLRYSKGRQFIFFRKFEKETERFIIDEYEIDGYEKMVLSDYNGWKAAKTMFGWKYLSISDYMRGVVFYKESALQKYMMTGEKTK